MEPTEGPFLKLRVVKALSVANLFAHEQARTTHARHARVAAPQKVVLPTPPKPTTMRRRRETAVGSACSEAPA